MKLKLIKLLNKVLRVVNKVYSPKPRYTKEQLLEELKKLKGD